MEFLSSLFSPLLRSVGLGGNAGVASKEEEDLRARIFDVAAYDENSHLFDMDSGFIGFGFISAPLTSAEERVQESMNSLLNLNYPTGTLIQATMYASPDIEPALKAYRDKRVEQLQDPLYRKMTDESIQFLRDRTTTPVDRASGLRIRDVRIIWSVKVPKSTLTSEADQRNLLSDLRTSFAQTLKTIGFRCQELDAAKYCRLMNTILCHGKDATWRSEVNDWYDDQRPLFDQILDTDTDIRVQRNGLWLGDTRVRLMHPKRYPRKMFFGDALRILGDLRTGARGIRENVLVTCNIYFPDAQSIQGRFEVDETWSVQQSDGRMVKYVPQIRMRKESIQEILNAARDGDRIVQAYLGVALFTPGEKESIGAVANARTYLKELDFQMLEDSFLAAPLFTNLLPFGADPASRKLLMRYRTYATRHVVPMLPVLGEWRGTGTPLLPLISRTGQLMSVSPFDSNQSYNAIVAAPSGRGKSFLVNAIVQALRGLNAKVYIIDIGRSYKKLCKSMNGEYIEFSANNLVSLNPFAMVENWSDDADVLASLIEAMAAPREALNDFQFAGLRRVLRDVWDAKQKSAIVDDLADALKKEGDQRLRDIGEQLFPFTQRGEYAQYFREGNVFTSNNDFVVLELEELSGRQHLQRIVLMMLLVQIQRDMFMGSRNRLKGLFVDEAWDLLANSAEAARFIEKAYRRFRKYNASAFTITQGIDDYYRSASTEAIVNNSPTQFILGQKPEVITKMKAEDKLGIGDAAYEVLRTVHTIQGEYSEILVKTDDYGSGVGRLVVSDFDKLLYSTTPKDVHELDVLTEGGLDIVAAINQLLVQRGARPAPAKAVLEAA